MDTAVEKRTILKDFLEHVTTVTHVLLLGLTIYIVWICASKEITFSFVTYHVILCTIGCTFLMNVSVFCMSEYNFFTKYLNQAKKMKVHLAFQVIGFGLGLGGFLVVVTDNGLEDRPHFVSAHGIIGLLVVVFGVVAYIISFALYYPDKFEKYINPNISKLCHVCFGVIAVTLGAAATITGFYTPWFKYRVNLNYTIIELCLVITVLTLLWTLVSPSLRTSRRIKSLIN